MNNNSCASEPLPGLKFDKNRRRVKFCPCGQENHTHFVPYKGYENKGYCHTCGKTFLPELPKAEQWNTPLKPKQALTPPPKPVSFIPFDILEQSLQQYSENNFVKFLCGLFGTEITNGLIEKYYIGTSKHWNGATVFWQIDISGKFRTGKIMLYYSDTGKRVKEKINWVHSILKIENFNLQQCFFGEHLLKGNTKPVAIFESEKTAVIASVYFPELICIACGSLTNISAEKCKVLQGRNVILYPDLNGFQKWNEKKKELSRLFPGTRFTISDLLERKANETERQQGLDLADYLIRSDYRAFQQQEQPEKHSKEIEQPQQKEITQVKELHTIDETYLSNKTPMPESWEQDITELEHYFTGITLPIQPLILNSYSTITNVSLYIESHLTAVKANNGNRTFLPYLERLTELQKFLTLQESSASDLYCKTN